MYFFGCVFVKNRSNVLNFFICTFRICTKCKMNFLNPKFFNSNCIFDPISRPNYSILKSNLSGQGVHSFTEINRNVYL